MLNTYIYHQLPPACVIFVTPSSGTPLRYLLKNIVLLTLYCVGDRRGIGGGGGGWMDGEKVKYLEKNLSQDCLSCVSGNEPVPVQ
jgi:hypothetical protein